MAFPVHKIALRRHLPRILLNEAGVVVVGDKADLLAVLFMGHLKPQLLRHLPDLLLRVLSHRHQGVGQLILGQIVQGVGLIRTYSQTSPEKRFPFHVPVAGDAGIGGAAPQVFVHKIVHDPFLELPLEIHHIVGNSQLAGHPSGVLHGA